MENKYNLVIKIDSEENSKKSEEKTNSILINDDKESKNINYSNINSENINIKEEKKEIKNDDLKEENVLIKLKNWFLSKSIKFKLILIISSVILLSLLLTLIIVLSKKHSNSSIKKDSDNLNINNNLSKRVGEDGENEGNDEFGYHILLHEVSEITGRITITQKSLTNVAFYTRKVKAITDYMVVNVNINIPLTGNDSGGQYSRIITYFDDEVICDSTIYNSDAWEMKPITINGYVKNVRQGEHTITIKAAVSAGTLHIPHFDSNSVTETIKPRIQYSYFVAGYV